MKWAFVVFFFAMVVLGKAASAEICTNSNAAISSAFLKNIGNLKSIPEVFVPDPDVVVPAEIVENLHYVNKYYKYNSKKCKANEVFVEGPLFSEKGVLSVSPADQSRKKNLMTSEKTLLSSRGNSFCVDKKEFDKNRKYAQSIFQTRVATGSKNEGTSFLVGPDVVMTNYHIAVPLHQDPHNCRSLEIRLNSENGEWISCSKVLYCNKDYDVCFVEMKKSKSGQSVGELAPHLKLSTAEIQTKNYNLIGNSYSEGIQSSRGRVLSSVETQKFDGSTKQGEIIHYVPMIGGSSGSPIINERGQVIAINKAHHSYSGESARHYVSENDGSWNLATSMKFMKSDLLQKLQAAPASERTDLKKALDSFK